MYNYECIGCVLTIQKNERKMEQTFNFNHTPVMLNECIEGLNIKPNGIYVDGTLGGAGHSSVIASKLTTGKLICIDKDSDALRVAKERLSKFDCVQFVKSDFKEFAQILKDLQVEAVDGVLLDLGVSSYQLDTADRGFSYRFDGPLDMRMDKESDFSAYNVVNEYSIDELTQVIRNYGEEQFARNIAKNIVLERESAPIETTSQLNAIVEKSIPRKLWGKGSVAKKTFQAIRIEVNNELRGLDKVLNDIIDRLNKGGRLAVITFHSLEDRIVKNVFKDRSTGCICDRNIPICVCGHTASVKLVNKKPIVASGEELDNNKRSSSAKLRVVEKL